MAITELALNEGVKPADLDTFERLTRHLGVSNGFTLTRPAVTDPANPVVGDMLGVYTPGTTFEMYEEGTAKLLKGGDNLYLDFNIHYQTTGKPEKDRAMIGLWIQPGPPKRQIFRVPGAVETIIADGKELLMDAPGEKAEGTHVAIPPIPPYADNYEVVGISAYTEPVTIYQFQPHAHLRSKDFKYAVVYPDGHETTVLSVPKYDFNWQLAYELDTPLKLPAGSALVVTAHYDNSLNNKSNPGPEKEVHFRRENQSWDEMFTPFIQYASDNQDLQQGHNEKANAARHQDQGEQSVYHIAEVVGCLEQGPSGTWMLTNASDPVISKTQATSSVALKDAKSRPLGNQRHQLVNAGIFNSSSHQGQKVAVKGVMINDAKEIRFNVTSLQMVATTCFK
jgi:hypothetical protein